MIVIQQEKWDNFYPECVPLFIEHHAEIVDDEYKMPFDLDADTCAEMDRANNMVIISARKNRELIGYGIFLLSNSLMSKSLLCATQAPYFVTATERKSSVGLKIYREAIKVLNARGVKRLFPHYWLMGGGEKLGKFFEHLGAKEIQHEYCLVMGV